MARKSSSIILCLYTPLIYVCFFFFLISSMHFFCFGVLMEWEEEMGSDHNLQRNLDGFRCLQCFLEWELRVATKPDHRLLIAGSTVVGPNGHCSAGTRTVGSGHKLWWREMIRSEPSVAKKTIVKTVVETNRGTDTKKTQKIWYGFDDFSR